MLVFLFNDFTMSCHIRWKSGPLTYHSFFFIRLFPLLYFTFIAFRQTLAYIFIILGVYCNICVYWKCKYEYVMWIS